MTLRRPSNPADDASPPPARATPPALSGATLTQEFRVGAISETVTGHSWPQDELDHEARATGLAYLDDGELLPSNGDIVGEHYRLVKLLGSGMFGRVFVAERTDVPEHRVALKLVQRQIYAGRNVERELVMLAAATHPHIVQLKDHGMAEHYVWLTMPLYEGETLAERLERGPLSLREAYDIFLPVAQGLQALHKCGLRHQDIKPENIFLAQFADRVHPVLLDLGVAVETNSSFIAGTVLYGAPEQVMALGGGGHKELLSEKIDTYCLATTLLRSLVGPEFFPGENANTPYDLASAFAARENEPLATDALSELTGAPRRALSEALSLWLARNPATRPSTAELAEHLDVLLAQEREATLEIERGIERQKMSLRRLRVAAGAMLLVGLGVAAFGFSKRETLRLAGELERVKAEGAASFDKLDTCVASHELVSREAKSCDTGWQEDKEVFRRTLDIVSAEGERTQTSLARRVTTATARLHTCRDESTEAANEWSAEKDQLTTTHAGREAAWEAEVGKLVRERDDQKAAHNSCETQFGRISTSRNECRADLAGCIDERDLCMSEPAPVAAAAPQTAPIPPKKQLPPAPVAPREASIEPPAEPQTPTPEPAPDSSDTG